MNTFEYFFDILMYLYVTNNYSTSIMFVCFLLVGVSPGFIGSGETDQSGHGVSWRGNLEGETEFGERNAHSENRERQTGS